MKKYVNLFLAGIVLWGMATGAKAATVYTFTGNYFDTFLDTPGSARFLRFYNAHNGIVHGTFAADKCEQC